MIADALVTDSVARVEAAARAAGLDITVRRMGALTRTAEEAAAACGCDVGQIVKSLIFRDRASGAPLLFLIGGDAQLDLTKAREVCGVKPSRVDAAWVRDATGFAIGGVSPLGHRTVPRTFMDSRLLDQPVVWAATGAQDAVFETHPADLAMAAGASIASLT